MKSTPSLSYPVCIIVHHHYHQHQHNHKHHSTKQLQVLSWAGIPIIKYGCCLSLNLFPPFVPTEATKNFPVKFYASPTFVFVNYKFYFERSEIREPDYQRGPNRSSIGPKRYQIDPNMSSIVLQLCKVLQLA